MGLFNELTKRALEGAVGAETADMIANKLDKSNNPTVHYYKNKVDNAFVQSSNQFRQNHPKITQAYNTAIQTYNGSGNDEVGGNALPTQYVQEQPVNNAQQNQNNVVNPIDRSMWEFE